MTAILRRIASAVTIIVAVAVMFVPTARGTETQDPGEWIFSVIMPPQWTIADAVFAYQFKDGFYLPIIDLAQGYEFFIEAETDRAFATGFAGREENTFTIDGERGELIIAGKSESLPADAILEHDLVPDDDIYVRMDVLNRIWPVEMHVELSSITIIVEAEEELSFIRRKKREDRQEIFKAQRELLASERKTLPFRSNPYQWFGKPAFDLQASYIYDNREKELTGRNSITGTQQLGKFVADFNANYTYRDGELERPNNIRLKLSRQAPGDEYLLAPTVKRVEFGDVSLGQRDFIGSQASGRGFVFSNQDSVRTREFDRITVEGTGPPGWELELYNNNVLLRLGEVEEDGEYRFEDVILNFGNNRIRVVLYGPQGQIREHITEHQVAGSLLSPGDFSYRAGIVDVSRSFIQLEDIPSPTEPHITRNFEASYGLNKWLTLFGSYTRTPFDDDEEQYYTGGMAFTSPLGVGEIEGYRQINGGSALDMRFITQLMGIRLNTRTAFFRDFESQNVGQGNGARRFETNINASTRLNLPFIPLTFNVGLDHVEFAGGDVSTQIDTSQSFTGGGIRFNHTTSTRVVNEIHENSTGGATFGWYQGRWQAQGGFAYHLFPDVDLNSGNAEIRYKTPDNFQAALNAQHSFADSITQVGTQVGYDFGNILSTLDAQYRQERGWQFTVRATTSLHPYTPEREYILSSGSRQNNAAVLGRIFVDADNDRVFSEGDEPLPGVRLSVNKSRSLEVSNEDGYVVSLLQPDQISNVSIDEASLKDPYFRPAVDGYSTVGLRGTMPGFDFPVVETGAIDGTVWREPSGRPVSGMKLELVTPDGDVYMTTESAFDGYYAFEFVVPGTYTVRADPSYQVNVPAETVTVSSEELFAFGIDLYLLEPAAEENAADQVDGASGGIAQLPTTAPAVSGTTRPAPVSPPDEGSSLAGEEPSDEDSPPAAESSVDEGRSLADQSDSSGRASSAGPSIVKDVRVGEYPDAVRLVLDLSGPAFYDIDEGNGLVVLIDMPGTIWDTVREHDFTYSNVLKSYKIETLPDKGTRLILKARSKMAVKDHRLLPAENGKPDRLIIDLTRQ